MGNGYTVGVCNGYVTRNSAVSRHGVSFVNNYQKLMLIPIVVTNFLQDAVNLDTGHGLVSSRPLAKMT